LQVLVNYYRVILPSSQPGSQTQSAAAALHAVAGVSYHHRSSKRHRATRRAFQSKTPLVISEAVQATSASKNNRGAGAGGLQGDVIGDDWHRIDGTGQGNDDSDFDVDSDEN
jgi:hypothetical protein